MSRKHLFPIVVMLAAAVVAGLLAVSHTVASGQPANAATASDPAIAFRLKRLDRFEQSLRRQLASMPTSPESTLYRRAPSVTPTPSYGEEEHYEGEDRDD